MSKFSLVLSVFFFLPSSAKWTLLRNEDNIKLYTRKVEGYKIKEVKASTTFNAPIKTLEDLLRDIENHTDWFDECQKSEVLKRISKNEAYVRFVLRVPFPFRNRDIVTKLKFKKISKTKFKVYVMNKPNYIPKKRGLVRTPYFKSTWILESIANGTKTKTTTLIHADMGGLIPTWAINSAVKWGPFLSLKKIRHLVE